MTDSSAAKPNFLLQVQMKRIAGYSIVHKFGRNSSVANATWEAIHEANGLFNFPTAAVAMRVKAGGNAADDNDNGAGARAVVVEGLDSTGAPVSETLTLAGADASAASNTLFWRTNRMYVTSVGTYGVANTGVITLEDSAGAANRMLIPADVGQTLHGAYAVPLGKRAYILSIHANVDANKAADIRMYTRENLTDTTAPMSPLRLQQFFDAVKGSVDLSPLSPLEPLAPLTDVWFETLGSGASTEVDIDFEILLEDV